MTVHAFLQGHRSEVLACWLTNVRAAVAAETMSPVELIDHIPSFLEELIAALQPPVTVADSDPASPSAAMHGENRLRLGFSLDAVVREYGVFVDAIVTTARTAGVALSVEQLQQIFAFTVKGIARAVSEYSAQREADLRHQTNEHFAFVAHELRNPLSVAATALETMLSTEVVPAAHPIAAVLQTSLNRTSQLIDQSLRHARVTSGVDLRREPTTLTSLFEAACSDVTPTATVKGVAIRVSLGQDTMVELDSRLVRSAIDNLLRNAIKHTAAGGTVELRGEVVDGRAAIEVEDCCGGVDPTRMEEAFAPFVRLESKQQGFGLGLAIVRQAVDAHGGTIRVQNVTGKGCIIVISLPIADKAPDAPGAIADKASTAT